MCVTTVPRCWWAGCTGTGDSHTINTILAQSNHASAVGVLAPLNKCGCLYQAPVWSSHVFEVHFVGAGHGVSNLFSVVLSRLSGRRSTGRRRSRLLVHTYICMYESSGQRCSLLPLTPVARCGHNLVSFRLFVSFRLQWRTRWSRRCGFGPQTTDAIALGESSSTCTGRYRSRSPSCSGA